jgi:hypothetical protein
MKSFAGEQDFTKVKLYDQNDIAERARVWVSYHR